MAHNEPYNIVVKRVKVAEVRPVPKNEVRRPQIGAAKGEFVVPDSFFEPSPDEFLKGFNGKTIPFAMKVLVDNFAFLSIAGNRRA